MDCDELYAEYQAFYQLKRQHFKNRPYLANCTNVSHTKNPYCMECGERKMFLLSTEIVGVEIKLCGSCSTIDLEKLECFREKWPLIEPNLRL